MKIQFTETPEPPKFVPFEITLKIQTPEDLKWIYEAIGNTTKHYDDFFLPLKEKIARLNS